MRARSIGLLLVAAVLVAGLSLKALLLTPPAVPAVATAGGFDAARALGRLTAVLNENVAHPVDTAANDRVRDRIVAQLRAEGLTPRIDDAVTCNSRAGARGVSCARVRNIVAEIGPSTGPALALVAHYDSTPTGPGAADDGIGYASLLEIAHLLRGAAPKRGIILLLTDGEEAGLIGARAFVDRDPVARRVTHLINLEARGVSGPAFMFETSRPNGEPIARFRAAAERPVANSLSTDFYRLIPNSTDVAVFEAKPWSILNFAIIGNETRYHSPGDTPDALDPRSLYHMGSQVLALARDWAAGRDPTATGTRVYADALTRALITLPLAPALAWLAFVVLILAYASWRRDAILRAVGAPLAATLGALAIGWLGSWIAGWILTGEYWRGHPQIAALAVDIGAVGSALVALTLIGDRLTATQARAGAWLFVAILGAVTCAIAPGAAIFFLIPPSLVLLGMVLARRWPAAEPGFGMVAAVLVCTHFAELVAQIELLLVAGPIWVTAALVAPVALIVLIEARQLLGAPRAAVASVATGIAVVAGWGVVLATPRATADRKARFVIEHVADANAGSARWGLATDGAALPREFDRIGRWTSTTLPWSNRPRWVTTAPVLPMPPLDAVDVRRSVAGPIGRVAFRIVAPGATSVLLQFPPDAAITSLALEGSARSIDPSDSAAPYALRCTGRSCNGAVVTVDRRSPKPLIVTMSAMYPGLPATARPIVALRPVDAEPQYSPDARYVINRVRL